MRNLFKMTTVDFFGRQIILNSTDEEKFVSSQQLINTQLFEKIVELFIKEPSNTSNFKNSGEVVKIFRALSEKNWKDVMDENPELGNYFKDRDLLRRFWSELYNFWRSYDRYYVYYSKVNDIDHEEYKPYTTFSETIEKLNNLVRKLHRDVAKNISGVHQRVYRQLPGCCKIGVIATRGFWSSEYKVLDDVGFIRQILLEQPLIIYPLMNKRSGRFMRVKEGFLDKLDIKPDEWLCYPAKVGELIIYCYFHKRFMDLGTALVNLFWMASDEELKRQPDAIFLHGVNQEVFSGYDTNTIYCEDGKMLIGATPAVDRVGYFGYLKKMMLTLHNVKMMKLGRLPVHGAMIRIELKNGKNVNVVIWGDTGTGKSETIEALRVLGKDYVNNISIVFDDMGSLEYGDKIKGYGTETGAFIRLDDLQPGFALTNVDKAIIMDPLKINARAVVPVTSYKEITYGYRVDVLLYANNYEDGDLIEKFDDYEKAMEVFRRGARMAKGTTDETGLVESFYANIFGPEQYKELYEGLAKKFFIKMCENGTLVGQIRTRLGLKGFEKTGPVESAKGLLGYLREL